MTQTFCLMPFDDDYFRNKKIKAIEGKKKGVMNARSSKKNVQKTWSEMLPFRQYCEAHSPLADVISNFSLASAQICKMSPATGDGKTYASVEFIVKSFMASLPKFSGAKCLAAYRIHVYDRYIFMTPIKANLPKERIKKFIRSCLEDLKIEGFKINDVVAESERLYEVAVQEFSSKDDVPAKVFAEAVSVLKDIIEKFRAKKENKSGVVIPAFKEILKSHFLQKCEASAKIYEKMEKDRDFQRDEIEGAKNKKSAAYAAMLDGVFKTVYRAVERIEKIHKEKDIRNRVKEIILGDERFAWLERVCPTMRSESKRIWLMSSDKFLFANILPYKKCAPFRTEIAQGAYGDVFVVIDEFDQTYERWMVSIVERSVVGQVDVLDVFRKISMFYEDGRKALPNDDTYEKFGAWIHDFSEKEHLNKPVLAFVDGSPTMAYFGYPSGGIFMGSQARDITFAYSDGVVTARRAESEKSAEDGRKSFFYALSRLNDFLFKIFFPHLVDHAKLRGGDDIRKARGIFDGFVSRLGVQEMARYFKEIYGSKIGHFSVGGTALPSELCIANTGAAVLAVTLLDEISEGGGRQMRAFAQEVLDTPEKAILGLFHGNKKIKVLAVSATADVESCIGNFDFGFLRRNLKFYEYSQQDTDSMLRAGERNRKHSGKSRVSRVVVASAFPHSLGELQTKIGRMRMNSIIEEEQAFDEILFDALKYAVKDDDMARRLLPILSIGPKNGKGYIISKGYRKKILDSSDDSRSLAVVRLNEDLKSIFAFDEFLRRERVRTCACFMNAYPEKEFKKSPLYKCFLEMCGRDDVVTILKNESFDDGETAQKDLETICKNAANGGKHFIITTYGFASRGMNFVIPYATGKENFSGIYLECPTHVMVTGMPKNATNAEKSKVLMKGLIEQRQFLERGEIDFALYATNANGLYSSQANDMRIKKLEDAPGYRLKCTQIAMQTVGRIQREEKYSEETLFLVDEEFLRLIEMEDYGRGSWAAEQLGKLKDEWERSLCVTHDEDEADLVRRIRLKNEEDSRRRKNRILKYFKVGWTKNAMNDWEADRAFLLAHPTLSEKDMLTFRKDSLYVRMLADSAAYAFETANVDGSFMEKSRILFNGYPIISKKGNEDGQVWKRVLVNEETCRLKRAMMISGFEEWMGSKGYATSFRPATYIMSPFSYFNYLGALGEEIFSFYVERKFGMPPLVALNVLEEDPTTGSMKSYTYEKFDFMSRDGSLVVDVKHWNINYRREISEESEIARKVAICIAHGIDVRDVLYVNLFSENEGLPCEPPRTVTLEDGRTFKLFIVPQLYVVKDGKAFPDGESFGFISNEMKRS